MNSISLENIAKKVEEYVISTRNTLHKIPEIRFEEEETLLLIKEEIKKVTFWSKDIITITEKNGGIWVDITFNKNFDRILFRSDVDGLPVEEKTGLPFSSKKPGKMHACGHDIHVAMLLGAMCAITSLGVEIKHNLRFVFQRAEENPITESGGAMLVREGVCDDISAAYALHIWTEGGNGIFKSCRKEMLGNSDRMKVDIKCSGGHVAFPQKGINANNLVFEVIKKIKILEDELSTPLPISIINSGKPGATNVMPAEAEIWFNVRTFLSLEERKNLHDKIKTHIESINPTAIQATAILGHPALHNNPTSFDFVQKTLTASGETATLMEPMLGGEDFAHYLNKVGKGCMWTLCAENPGTGSFHQPTFNPDPSVFWKGVHFWLLLATN